MRYGSANHSGSSANARGTDAAMTNAAAVAARVTSRTIGWVVSAGLRVQVNWVHAHQISQKRTSERTTPAIVRSCAVSAVSWVTAKTKTRSKNSSTKVTDCSCGAWSRAREGPAFVRVLMTGAL
jgi:hypothetical protein